MPSTQLGQLSMEKVMCKKGNNCKNFWLIADDKTFYKEATEATEKHVDTDNTGSLPIVPASLTVSALGGAQDVRSCCAWDIVSHWRGH